MAYFNIAEIEQVIKRSLEKSILSEGNNKLKSTIFVSTIADLLFDNYKDSGETLSLNAIGYDKESGRKPGEKMLDITIAKTKTIYDPDKKQSTAVINYQLVWAIESEADTSLPAFADDFGKLLCSNSMFYLYLNGLDQVQEESRTAYINRRLAIAKELLNDANLNFKNFYYAFWPSPHKNQNHDKSFWDMHQKDKLLDMVRVYEL
jgi:hypothetical protein